MTVYARGLNNLIRDMYMDHQLAHKLIRKMCDVGKAIHKFYRELGLRRGLSKIETVDLYDNFLGHFSPSLIRKFVLPYYRKWVEKYGWKHWNIVSQCVLDPLYKDND